MLLTKAPDLDAWEQVRGYPLLSSPLPSMDSPEWRETAEQRQLHLLSHALAKRPESPLAA
jgi:hypothetical protein